MRFTHLVKQTPLEKLINKLLADSLILTLHPLSFLPASTQARQAFCFLIRGGPTLLNCLSGHVVVGHERKEAEYTCIKKPTMPTTMEEGGKEEARKRVGEGAKQGRPAISESSGLCISQLQPGQTAQPGSPGNSQG